MRSDDIDDVLRLFISSLCEQAKARNVLEYANDYSQLTGRLVSNSKDHEVAFVPTDQCVPAVLQLLHDEEPAYFFRSISDLPDGGEFDAIVCLPPIGRRPTGDSAADGFGGEVVRELVPWLARRGTLFWVTGRGAVFQNRPQRTLSNLQENGLSIVATIDLPPGAFPGTKIEGVVIALRREVSTKRFVAILRDLESAEAMASAFLAGPSRKSGPNWTWLDEEDHRTFADLERARLLEQLTPRGRHSVTALGSVLTGERVVKADKPVADEDQTSVFLFVPEYAGSRVTADLDEQTVVPKSVYRLCVDPTKVNPRFLAQLLNSPYGKQVRALAAHGVTIQRISLGSLRSLDLPIPNMETQNRVARIDSDIGLLQAALQDMRDSLDQDWTTLPDISAKIDGLKAVLDIERRIVEWWSELPYPLATIYRRYQVTTEPKERFDTVLHFFEMAAVFLATIGLSHVKAMRQDWQEVFVKWLHPAGAAGINRADFGFWINLAGASLKDTSRIASDKDLRATAIELAGPELVQVAESLCDLRKATEVLEVAKQYRNSWKGHGGHIKVSDARRLDDELQQSIRDLYEITASVFRRFHLVRPGLAEVTDTGMKFEIEKLSGSDPTFDKQQVELDQAAKSNALAFWMDGSRTMCRALPFLRLGPPQKPQDTSFYVFNRIENGSVRWVSYQEAGEQEVIATDEELLELIGRGREAE